MCLCVKYLSTIACRSPWNTNEVNAKHSKMLPLNNFEIQHTLLERLCQRKRTVMGSDCEPSHAHQTDQPYRGVQRPV